MIYNPDRGKSFCKVHVIDMLDLKPFENVGMF